MVPIDIYVHKSSVNNHCLNKKIAVFGKDWLIGWFIGYWGIKLFFIGFHRTSFVTKELPQVLERITLDNSLFVNFVDQKL